MYVLSRALCMVDGLFVFSELNGPDGNGKGAHGLMLVDANQTQGFRTCLN